MADQVTSGSNMEKTLLELPDELLLMVNQMLNFEDRLALAQTCQRTKYLAAVNCSFTSYDILQVCDLAGSTYLEDSLGKKPKLPFQPKNAPLVLSKATNLKEISIYMREVDLSDPNNLPAQSPYTRGGYLRPLLGAPGFQCNLNNLEKVSLHCDMLVDTIANKQIFAPYQDLEYAMNFLANQKFETVVQLTLCSTHFTEQDAGPRDMLVCSMQEVLKHCNTLSGTKTKFEPFPNEGYVDMTVEYGKLEYNFSFFYYNPEMCDPEDDCMPDDTI